MPETPESPGATPGTPGGPSRPSLPKRLFGELSWSPPPWAKATGAASARGARATRDFVKGHRRGVAATLVALLALSGAGYSGYRWWESRPKPVEFSVSVQAPGLTAIEENPTFKPVRIKFGGSAARLDQVGKRVLKGITLSPAHPGDWRWADDHTLVFEPTQDWPVGQEFKVELEKQELFPEHVRLQEYEATFKTAPFTASIPEIQLYQDPRNPKIKRVEATISFSHPVDSAAFARSVSLRTEGQKKGLFSSGKEEFPFTVTFDKLKGQAFVHSDPVPIPANDSQMVLVVKPGAKAALGGQPLEKEVSSSVDIPGMYTFFHVSSAAVTLVRNDKFEPEQVLVIQLTDGVTESELQKNVSVWLLPKDLPAAPGRAAVKSYNWSDPTLVGNDILATTQKVQLQAVPTEHEYSKLHSFKVSVDVNRHLFVRLKQGTQSVGGYILAKEFETSVNVPPFPQEVSILHEGALLGMTGEKKLTVMARDVRALQFEVGRVIPQQIAHMVSQTSGHFSHPSFNNYSFNEDNIVERIDEVRPLEPAGRGKAQYAAFDFTPHVKDQRGLFFFKVRAWDPDYKRPSGPEDSRLILITDLGVLVKDNADGSHDVFVQSIGKGEAAAGAVVSVLGKNGLPVLSQTSDADGRTSFPKLNDFRREHEPVAWLVRRGEDVAFMPVDRGDRQLNFSRFDVGGLYGASSPDRLNAFLFSDRGLYRPGDTFHVAGIVKPADWGQTVNGIPLEVAITDPRGLEIHKQKMALNESGFLEIGYATEETSPTGQYQVSFYVVSDGRRASLLGSTTVRVEEFLPDRMKIVTRFSSERLEGWVSPEGLKGQVSLKNLFGIPANGNRVSAEITLSPAYPVFRPYRDYTFYDPMVARKSFSERLEDGTTDDEGNVEFELNLERFEKATYRVSLLAEGYEKEGGRGVSSEASVVVSPMPFLVGHKPDGSLRYIQKDAARNVQLIAVDPALKKIAARGLKAQLLELRWVSVLTQLPNGTFQYQSVQKEIVVSKKEMTIPAEGLTYALNTGQPGDFALLVRDGADTEIARVTYSVAGKANLQRALERNAELELKLAKSEFSTGEEIEMQIKAPYVGAGLITIERDRVYAQKWFKTDTTASVQTIKVPAGLEGNGYVNVAFVRSMSSAEIFMSPLSYAVAPFSVNHESRVNAITLESAELARPGEPYRIKYKGTKTGKAVIYAVDEGILQVAAYSTPDPLAFFFKKRALEVRTAQILDLLLPEFAMVKASSTGGDEGYDAIGKNLNPFKRKRDKPVAYWSGIVDIDTTERTLTYDVPDSFNGSLRVMAVAVSPQAVGASSRKAVIRAPFVLSPSVPTFVAPGDEFQVSVGVANGVEGSGKDLPVAVEVKAGEQLEVLDGTTREVKVSEGREGSVTFRIRAKKSLGSANLTFFASGKDKKSKQSVDLSVRPPVPYLTTVSTGSLKDRKVEIPVARRMYKEYRKNDVAASVLPLGLSRGLMMYLDDYPYGCTEQIVSRAFPSMLLRSRRDFGVNAAAADQSFGTALKILQTRQNDRGAFGFWAANSYVSDFQVAYAAHFLTEAKERGQPVPPEVLARALVYLRSLAARPFSSDWEARDRAYALYVLARNGGATGALITQLRDQVEQSMKDRWKSDLTAAYLAGAYKLVKQDKLAEKAMSGVKIGGTTADYVHFYDGLLHDAGVLYIASRHFPERLDSLSGPAIAGIAAPITSGWYNTLSSSYAILALDAYLTALGNRASVSAMPFTLSQLIDKQPQSLKLPDGLFPHLTFSEQASKLILESSTDTPAFFQVTQAGFDLDPPSSEIKEQLEVQRELQTLEGKVVKEVPLGSEVEVHLKLRSVQGGGTAHVAIVDLLPGGFEVVMDRPRPARAEEESSEEEHAEESEGGEGEGEYQGEGEGSEEGASAEGEGDEGGEPEYTSGASEAGYGYVPPIGAEKSSFSPEYVDVREDRVVLYGRVDSSVSEFVYRIKATNQGQFTMPPAFAEGMYDRRVRARSVSGSVKVDKP